MKNRSTFQPGSGCFTCSDCGKLTRDTMGNGDSRLCPVCYEMEGARNMFYDGYPREEVIAEIKRILDCDDETAERKYAEFKK